MRLVDKQPEVATNGGHSSVTLKAAHKASLRWHSRRLVVTLLVRHFTI